jgi:hypothetical protein
MRSLIPLILTGLLLAACGTTPPEATPGPSAEATQSAVTNNPTGLTPGAPPATEGPRQYTTDQPPLPAPGTIVAATEDPNAGLVFDSLTLERTGGISGERLTVQVLSNGSVLRNGAASTISADQVTQIDALLDRMNFFQMQGVFTAPGAGADLFTYAITAERAGAVRTITAQDGLIPPELQMLITVLVQLGQA